MRTWLLIGSLLLATSLSADEPLLKQGDRVALLGGTFVERMQSAGALEAELQRRRPDWQLSFRNLGWSGDDVHGIARKVFDQPEDGFKRLTRDIDTSGATVVMIAYGFSEASDGVEAVERFEPGLNRLVDAMQTETRRVILVTPIAMPGYLVNEYQESMDQCRAIVARVGQQRRVPVLEVDWTPAKGELTKSKLLPSEQGYANFASLVADRLVGGQASGGSLKKLQQLIADKNQLFFHRYRPQNETYLLLFRKHEQGNNAVDIPKFDPLIEAMDQEIWQTAKLLAN